MAAPLKVEENLSSPGDASGIYIVDNTRISTYVVYYGPGH
jgi:hypothetical protein